MHRLNGYENTKSIYNFQPLTLIDNRCSCKVQWDCCNFQTHTKIVCIEKRGGIMQAYLVAFTVALAVAYFSTPWVKGLAIKAGALDAPDARKVHKKPIPRLGGLAIYLGFVLAVLASMHVSREIVGLLLGGTVILMVGIIDDLKQLSAKVKLAGQIGAAFVLVMFNIRIEWKNINF